MAQELIYLTAEGYKKLLGALLNEGGRAHP